MTISKNGIDYTITEHNEYWLVSYTSGKLTAEYKCKKPDYETVDDVAELVRSNNFGG